MVENFLWPIITEFTPSGRKAESFFFISNVFSKLRFLSHFRPSSTHLSLTALIYSLQSYQFRPYLIGTPVYYNIQPDPSRLLRKPAKTTAVLSPTPPIAMFAQEKKEPRRSCLPTNKQLCLSKYQYSCLTNTTNVNAS